MKNKFHEEIIKPVQEKETLMRANRLLSSKYALCPFFKASSTRPYRPYIFFGISWWDWFWPFPPPLMLKCTFIKAFC